MNPTERKMLEIVRKGREEHGFLALKAEFEAEGTRTDEFLRLLEIARRGDVKVGLKLGGCEAIRDLWESKQFGVDYVIAPMIESPFALEKYIQAKNKVYTPAEREDVKFLFNIETITTWRNLDAIIATAGAPDGVDGAVFGRVDFCGSMGWERSKLNDDEVTYYVCAAARLAASAGLEFVTGGGVSLDALEALRRVRQTKLNRFETRKVIFDAAVLDRDSADEALLLAVEFELLWLKNKREYYRDLSREDELRISMLESRNIGANVSETGLRARA